MTDEENSVTFHFHFKPNPLLEFKYKDKDDLYAKFLKKARKLGFPVDGVFYCSDYDGDFIVVRNAHDFFNAVNSNYNAKVYFPCPPELDRYCTDSDKEEREVADKIKGKRASKKSKSKECCPYEYCKLKENYGSCSEFDPHYPVPWSYKTYMDPKYRIAYFNTKFNTMEPRCYSHRHCCCERLTKEFDKL